MKRFLSILTLALTLTLILSLALVITPSATTADENVVFIKDGGTGDGSSPENALGSAEGHETDYKKSSLYLAATQLKETSGTIVICGPTTLVPYQSNTDVGLPGVKDTLKITSVYNNVDYQTENAAQLNLSAKDTFKINIIASSPTLWENLTICTYTGEQVIAGNGYKTTFGEGITTKLADGVTGNDKLLSLAGGHRYSGFKRNTDLTVKSGTYYNVSGSTYGIGSGTYVQEGDVNLTLLGSTAIKNYIYGTGKASTQVNGNVNIEISIESGSMTHFYANGASAFGKAGCEVYVKVGGQRLLGMDNRAFDAINGTLKDGCFMADKYTLDLVNTNFSNLNYINNTIKRIENQKAAGKTAFDILYPVSWLNTDSITLINDPVGNIYKSDAFEPTGLSIEASFTNKKDKVTVYTTTIDYDKRNTAFKFEHDGINTLTYKYGDTVYHTRTDVIAPPSVTLEGAKIRTSMTNYVQGMKFVGRLTKTANASYNITDYGILVTPSRYLPDGRQLEYGKVYGMTEFKNSAQTIESIFDNGSLMRFGGVINEIRADKYYEDYTARAFIKYTYNGTEYTDYSNQITRNVYYIANQASVNPSEKEETHTFMTTNVIGTYNSYTTDKVYDRANSDELRAKAVEYMRKQASIQWTPSEDVWIFKPSTESIIFRKGTTYYGVPYTNSVKADAEYFEYLLDDDGTFQLNNTKANYNFPSHDINAGYNEGKGGSVTNQENAAVNYVVFPGNDCSSAIINAWNSVLTNRSPGLDRIAWTAEMMPGKKNNDILPVGDYVHPTVGSDADYIYTKTADPDSESIFSLNSQADIFDAYAQLKPGDAVVYYNYSSAIGGGTGHARMIVSVDRANKTVTTIEQQNSLYQNEGQPTANSTWKVDVQYTFEQLYNDGYIPVTMREFATGNTEQEYTVLTDMKLDTDTNTIYGKVEANRRITALNLKLTTSDNTEVYDHTIYYVQRLGRRFTYVYKPKPDYVIEETVVGGKKGFGTMDVMHKDSAWLSDFLNADYTNENPLTTALEGLTSGQTYKLSITASTAADRNIPLVTDYTFTK